MQTIRINRPPLTLPTPLMSVLPLPLRTAIEGCGAPFAEELRIHSDRVTSVTAVGRNYSTDVILTESDLAQILRAMCAGSLYAYGEQICQGYLSMEGGIRVGICGTAAIEEGRVIGVNHVTSLIVRIPHRVRIDAEPVLKRILTPVGVRGMLIYSPPGVGKTTLLRAVAEQCAAPANGIRVVIVDTRGELSYALDDNRLTLDILKGYPRKTGIEIAVRSLGAQLIVCDEIGNASDADAIMTAANCGVALVASAHAGSLSELLTRPVLSELHRARIFQTYLQLERHRTAFRYTFHDWSDARMLSNGGDQP